MMPMLEVPRRGSTRKGAASPKKRKAAKKSRAPRARKVRGMGLGSVHFVLSMPKMIPSSRSP